MTNKYILKLIFVHSAKIYLIAVFVNLLTYLLFLQGSYEPTDAVLRILNLDLLNGFKRINRHGWYIATIILMYLIYLFHCAGTSFGGHTFLSGCGTGAPKHKLSSPGTGS